MSGVRSVLLRSVLLRSLLLGTSCLSVAGLLVGAAQAQPGGGQVVLGTATITDKGANSTVIDQKTGKAIINWNSFSIGAGGTVTFNQPNANAIALNRVLGGGSSSIYGNLLANGQVWIINQNGILFGKGSRINVGGLIATTADISDANFAAGNYSFSGTSGASVVNQGTIRTKNGGSAVLSGASVQNQGLIQADTGTVVLGGSSAFTVDFVGDGLLKYAITAPAGQADNGQTGVSNSGTIKAAGGHVIMTARAAASVQDAVVNNTGMISATSAKLENGEVVLDGGDGDVNAGGTIDASGAGRGQTGGSVTITGHDITVADNTHINASGDAGGGSVRIGGDVQGTGTLPQAAETHVGRAVITANATRTGHGGKLVVWSNGLTDFSGVFSATGGSLGGDGGFIETSGHQLNIAPDVKVNTTAAHGTTGTWLLDPYNVTIASSSTSNGSLAAGTFTPSGNNSVLNVGTLQTALNSTDVIVMTGGSGSPGAQTGDITVAAPISWSSHTLTLDAYHSIAINANLNASGTAGLTLKTNDGGTGGDYVFNNGASANFANTSEALTINGTAYTLLNSMAALQTINTDTTTVTGNYALTTSLDATGVTNWTPIGKFGGGLVASEFSGSFDGLGHTISNLTITGSSNFVGLFGDVTGTIRDIGLVGGSMSGGDYVGGLVGRTSGLVAHTFSTATSITGGNYVGGLIGIGSATDSYATANVTGTANYVGGLIGIGTASYSHATGAVSGSTNVGGLVGDGSAQYSYATGAVSFSGFGGAAGGLIGVAENGIVTNSYATGAVSSTQDMPITVDYLGGLVGILEGSASVTESYATGSVSTRTGFDFGAGLVAFAQQGSSISQSYATGDVVSGFGDTAGLVLGNGGSQSPTVTSSYWDTQTTGISSGFFGTGLTTAQLQGALPAGFDSTAWGTGPGLYPYLKWQYPNGAPQVVSGTVSNLAGQGLGNAGLSILANGAVLGAVSTGANGYFYLTSASLPSSNGEVLAYLTSGATGASLAQNTAGSVTNLAVFTNGFLTAATNSNSYAAFNTALTTNLATAIGSNSAAQTAVNGLKSQAVIANGGAFVLDQAVNRTDGYLAIVASSGTVQQTATITAKGLVLGGRAAVTLNNTGNAISVLSGQAFTLSLTNGVRTQLGGTGGFAGLTVYGTTSGAPGLGGNASLQILNGNDLLFNAPLVAGGTLSLAVGGSIFQGATSPITANLLTGSAAGNVSLIANNQVATLDNFTSGSVFNFVNATNLDVGTVTQSAPNSTMYLTTLFGGILQLNGAVTTNTLALKAAASFYGANDATITQAAGSVLTATFLTVDANGTASLGGANHVHQISRANATTGNNAFLQFSMTNAENLQVANVNVRGVSLTTTGSGSIILNGTVSTGGNATLQSAGGIYQGAVSLSAHNLAASATGVISLVGANNVNLVGALGGGITTTGNYIAFTDNAVTVYGAITASAPGSVVTLKTTSGDLMLRNGITASNVLFQTAGAFAEESVNPAVITASKLSGTAGGNVILNGANQVASYGNISAVGLLSIKQGASLTVSGAFSVTGGTSAALNLTTADNVIVNGSLSSTGGVTLTATHGLYQAATGSITAAVLGGSATQNVSLIGVNHIGTVTGLTTAGSYLAVTNAQAMSIGDLSVSASGGLLVLKTTNAGDMTLTGTQKATTVTLNSGGGILQGASTAITATTLTGSAVGAVSLAGPNHVTKLGAFSAADNFSFNSAATLQVTGPVSDTAAASTLRLSTASGDIQINGAISTAGTLNLVSANSVFQSSSSVITANVLNGTVAVSTSLIGQNHIANIGNLTDSGSLVHLVNAGSIKVVGTVSAPGATLVWLQTTSGGDIVINGNIVSGLTATLDSAGGIFQSAPSVINATNLTGSATANVSLVGANLLTNLGPFTDTGSYAAFVNAQTLTVNGALNVTGPSSILSIKTTAGDINVNAALNADTVTLHAAGTVHQSATSPVMASAVLGRAQGDSVLVSQ